MEYTGQGAQFNLCKFVKLNQNQPRKKKTKATTEEIILKATPKEWNMSRKLNWGSRDNCKKKIQIHCSIDNLLICPWRL